MSLQLKYYFQYYPLKELTPNLVEIWQNTDEVLVAEEITGHKNPFILELPEIKNKFQVIRGKGATINLLSDTDMKFFNGLYHVDPQEFMIHHYNGDIHLFMGYLNAEMITEPYDINFNYPISLTANDGFSLMDRFSFVQADATNYTGLKSKFELLQIIFAKIGLPYDQYRIALSTTFTGYSGATESTILHESFVDCANFYNEDPAPMSLREVVESILAPYGAFITAIDGHIYITDVHTMAQGGSVSYKQFAVSTGNYVGIIAIPNTKTVSDIGYMGTGQSIELSGGVNKQVVSYSPYPIKLILEKSIVDLDEFSIIPSYWSTRLGFQSKDLTNNKYWDDNAAGWFEATYFGAGDQDNPDIHFNWATSAINTKLLTYKESKYVNISGAIQSGSVSGSLPGTGGHRGATDLTGTISQRRRSKYTAGVAFQVTGDILIKTKNNPYDSTQKSKEVLSFGISYRIKVGNKYFDMTTQSWGTSAVNSMIYTSDNNYNFIADKWAQIGTWGKGQLIVIGNLTEEIVLSGDLEFEFWSDHKTVFNGSADYVDNSDKIQEVWIRNITINLVNFDGSEIYDTDVEFIGLLDKTYQNEGEKIELTCGTDAQFSDRGKILWNDSGEYKHITEWTRNGQTFKIEELLLNSLCSNYRSGFITLMGMKLKNNFSLINVISDSFIGARKLMIKSANVNYEENTVECSLVEIKPDELTIIPSEVVGSNGFMPPPPPPPI